MKYNAAAELHVGEIEAGCWRLVDNAVGSAMNVSLWAVDPNDGNASVD